MNVSASGLEVTEYRGLDQVLTGNADIACSERATPAPDDRTCTLPIYPLQNDLPQIAIVRGVVLSTLSRDELRDRRRAAYAAMQTARTQQQELRGTENRDARVEWSWIFQKCRKEFRRLCRLAGVPA